MAAAMPIRPFMLQRHPAYRTQIEILRQAAGDALLPTLPPDTVEHERWQTDRGFVRRALRQLGMDRRPLLAAARNTTVYVSGSLPPSLYGILDRTKRAHLDADDPLSLFVGGTRGCLPGDSFRRWATILRKKLDDGLTLSFWTRIQTANFLANLEASESLDLLERGAISTIPPAIPPRVTEPRQGGDERLRCLSIASGKFWHKGVPEAILAVDRLARAGLPVSLTLIGEGLPPAWRAFVADKAWFETREKVTRDELDALFLGHDLLVFLSHHDTYGWVLLEAKSFGMPALTTDSYSRPEIVVHEGDGLLVREPFSSIFLPTSPISYAAAHIDMPMSGTPRVSPFLEPFLAEVEAALRRLTEDPALRRKLAAGALASVGPGATFCAADRAARMMTLLTS